MIFKDLIIGTDIIVPATHENDEISGIFSSTIEIIPNSIFVAYEGVEHDLHDYVGLAFQKGASFVIGTHDLSEKYGERYIKVDDGRKILALLAANWWGRPQDKLNIIGITGTDGKTTTCNMVYQIIKAAGYKAEILSTINSPGLHVTTPDAMNLHRVLADFVKNGAEWVVLETTSHSLALSRTFGLKYKISGLTNITPEHLDFHKTFENYIAAKSLLFGQSEISILPDDEIGHKVEQNIVIEKKQSKIIFYTKADLHDDISLKIPGEYNIKNAALASTIARELGIQDEYIKSGLESITDLKGRWEIMYDKDFCIVIDFAHTANSFAEVLPTAREYMKKRNLNGRLIHIFGCAGERDAEKRYEMGKMSGTYADKTILTSEDPRREQLSLINFSVRKGLSDAGSFFYDLLIHSETGEDYIAEIQKDPYKKHFVLDWRGSAITFAIKKLVRPGDLLIITGKGHEESLCFGQIEYPWTDQECVKINLELKNIIDS